MSHRSLVFFTNLAKIRPRRDYWLGWTQSPSYSSAYVGPSTLIASPSTELNMLLG